MDQIKLVAADLSQDETQQQEGAAVSAKANDLRLLSDLEMVLCGGGDSVICW